MRKLLMSLMLAVLLLSLSAAACALTVSGTLMNRNSAPLADLAVTLERQNGTSLTTRTGNNGEWRFNNVEPGTYRVSVRLPQNQVAAPMSVDSRLLPSNSENAHTPWMNIQEDTKIPLASSRTTAGISIDAFVDSNENGGHMSTEPSLAGVEISVYADGYTDLEPIATGTTNFLVTPHLWYYGLDYTTGDPTASATDQAITLNCPSDYVGQSGKFMTVYTFSSSAQWNTNVTIAAMAGTTTVSSVSIPNVPIQRNHSTEYSGNLFTNGGTSTLTLNDTWGDPFTGTW